jgi:rubrerythrin
MNKLCYILLLILFSCSGLEKPVEQEEKRVSSNLDSLIILADETINNLNIKKKNTEEAQRKLNKKLLNVVKLRKHYKDSLDNLRSLKLINRDSIIYDYKIEVCEIVDTVRVNIPDSICPVCVHKKEKSFFNIFKKKK